MALTRENILNYNCAALIIKLQRLRGFKEHSQLIAHDEHFILYDVRLRKITKLYIRSAQQQLENRIAEFTLSLLITNNIRILR